MHTQKKTAAEDRALQTSLLPTTPANALAASAPDEPKPEAELPAEVRQEQSRRLTKAFGTAAKNWPRSASVNS